MNPQLAAALQYLLMALIIALLGVAIRYTPALSKKLHDLIDARIKNERLRGILDRLSDVAMTAVMSVEQTIVSTLDPTKPLGDNAKKARDAALDEMKTHLGQKGLDEAKTVLGIASDDAVDKLLISYIESKVHLVNQAAPTTIKPLD